MRCLNCEYDNLPNARFCGHCGHALGVESCPKCGWSLRAEDYFCPGCGHPVHPDSPSPYRVAEKPEASVKPIYYTPKHLAERILTSRANIEGERKQTTVLFADIVSSTRLTSGLDAEEAANRLSPAVEAMRKAVFRYEGYVKPLGDGIEALFGVPLAHENHAVRGCYAALDILEAISKLNEELRREHGEFVQVRVGLNSGEVLVKSIRDDLLVELDAMGPTVALAARMENLASPGTVQMTVNTFALAEEFVQVESGGRVPVQGITEPVEVFQLKSARPVPTHFHAIAARGLTRFVGRELEMQTLTRAWEMAGQGHGQVMAFVGDPGVGKSRLFWEFIHSYRTEGWLVLEASSVSYGKGSPYLPVIDLVKHYFEIHPYGEERRIKEKVNGKLMTLDKSLLSFKAAIFALLELDVEDPQWAQLDPVQRRQKTLEALTGILLREAQVKPVCLVFEDLQWIDLETQALLDRMVEALPLAPIILFVNYRPEYVNHWMNKTYFTQLPIEPLPEDNAEELLDVLLGTRAELLPLKSMLIELTEGNPFFLEETIQSLVEQKILSGERGNSRLMQPISKIEVPASIQATLEARIDRLDPDHKQLLHYASVIGKSIPFTVLQAAVCLPEETLRSGLMQLQSSEFLYETKLYPEREYTFKHSLTCQVAYGTLPRRRQRSMHSQIMQAIEQLFANREAEHVEQLAHHAFRGAVWDKAVQYSFEAGKKSFDRSANREAVKYFEQALKALDKLPESRKRLELAVDIRFALRQALIPLGEVDRISEVLDETKPLIVALDDPKRAGQFEALLSNHYYVTGDQPQAAKHGRRGLAIAEKNDDFILQVEMAFRLGQTFYALANYHEAIKVLEWGVGLLGPDRELDRLGIGALPAVVCRTWLSQSCAELGEFETGMTRGVEAVELAAQVRHPLSIVFAHWGLGHVRLRKRDYRQAAVDFEKGLDVCKRWSLRVWFPRLASSVGIARALSGRQDEALPLLLEAVQTAQDMRFKVDEARLVERLASGYLMTSQYENAETNAHRALELAIQRGEPGHQAWTLRLLGEIFSRSDRPNWEKANHYFREALELAGSLHMRPLSTHCYQGIGRLHEKEGRREEAEAAFQAAAAIWRELGIHTRGP